MSPVEVITSIQRRRHWSAEQKRALVEEAEQPGSSMSMVARKYEVHPNQLFRWRRLMHEGALVAAGSEDQVVPLSEVKALKAKIRELERLLGKKTMEVEILKDAIEIAREPKSRWGQPLTVDSRHDRFVVLPDKELILWPALFGSSMKAPSTM